MSAQVSWSYDPPGATIDAFMCCEAFVRGIMGPIGSGKSTVCVVELWRRANEQEPGKDGVRRSRWAVIRNTFPELKTTTIKTWHQWFPQHVGQWREQGPPMHRLVSADLDCEVLFLALDRPDDVSKLLSLELTGAWINEAREVPKAVLDALTGRVGRFPPQRDGGPTWSGIIMDTNPPDTDHWWYRLAEESKSDEYRFFAQPAGDSEHAENIGNLPPNYYKRASAEKSDDWIKVYVKGEYGYAGDGKPVYTEYRDSIHCRERDLIPGIGIHVGLDFGLTPAAVIGQQRPNGSWLLRHELVADNMGATRFAEQLGKFLRGDLGAFPVIRITGDPAGDQRAQTDETTVFQILRAHKIPAVPANTNDFMLRREAVAAPLSRLVDGEPGLIIHPDCKTLRKGMAGGYCYRRIQIAGEERFRDVPDKNFYSHVNDAAQYLMLGGGEGTNVLRGPPTKPKPRRDPWDDDEPRGRPSAWAA